MNIYWTINNLQFQIQFLRNIIIDYSYMFFKDMDNHIKKIDNDTKENDNTKDFEDKKQVKKEQRKNRELLIIEKIRKDIQ